MTTVLPIRIDVTIPDADRRSAQAVADLILDCIDRAELADPEIAGRLGEMTFQHVPTTTGGSP